MASCELSAGILGVCTYSASGVERFWATNKSDISAVAYNVDGIITGFTFTTTGGTFYEIVPSTDSCTFQDDLQVAGSRKNFLQSVTFELASVSAATIQILESIGLANMVAIVKTADGSFRALGVKGSGLRCSVMTEGSGTSAGNDSSMSVTISGNATGKAPFVAASAMASYL